MIVVTVDTTVPALVAVEFLAVVAGDGISVEKLTAVPLMVFVNGSA